MEAELFQNGKNQVGFCGIWCGSCVAGNGAIVELARRFDKIVKGYNLEKWVPKDFDFKEFTKGLASIQSMPLCSGCRKGGGNPTCKVKVCALEKGIADCSLCGQLKECKNFERLEKENPKVKEGLMEIKKANRNELIEKWMSEVKTKWPHCIVYCTLNKK